MAVYKPKGYKDLAAAQALIDSAPKDSDFNPYDYIDQSFYKNNARGRMAYQEDLAKLLYMAQINQEERMNEYNSPEEQAKRMREAGLNPDLLGVSGEPAANVAGYQGNPMDGTQTTLQNTADIFGIMSSVTSMATGLASGALDFLSFPAKSTTDAVNLADAAFSFFGDNKGFSQMSSGEFGLSVDSLPLRQSQKRKLKSMYQSYRGTPQSSLDSFSFDTDRMKTRGEHASYFFNPRYNNEHGTDLNYAEEMQLYEKAWKPYLDALENNAIQKLKGDTAKSEYDQGYYGFSSGVAQRGFQESTQRFEETQREFYNTLRGPLIQVIKNFRDLDFKSNLGTYASAVLSALVLSKLNF